MFTSYSSDVVLLDATHVLEKFYLGTSNASGGHAKANLKYIGTRDGVQTPADTYIEYMSERPRSHGLFGDEKRVDMDRALEEMATYPGNIWTPILSLKREDAARLGYDTPEAWRALLRAHRNDIAEAFKIPPQHLRWYAAYHDEGDHPHVHMVVWSTEPKQGYLNTQGIEKLRSQLTNQIFQQEMLHVYEQKSVSRNELVAEARNVIREMARDLREGIQSSPKVETLMEALSMELGEVGGKMSYGYLPKRMKESVNQIVDELEQLPSMAECYERWQDLQWQVESYYRDTPKKEKRLSEQKEFRSIKNAVIQQAEEIRLGAVTFEDRELKQYEDADFDDRGPPIVTGTCGTGSRTTPPSLRIGTTPLSRWSNWLRAATPTLNTTWARSTGTGLC